MFKNVINKMNNETSQITQFFNSLQIVLSPIWLESCMEFCKENCLPSIYTIQKLREAIYEQWLVLDLREVEIPTLPANACTNPILNGSYSVQLMEIIDISKPKLWQHHRITGTFSLTRKIQNDSEIVGTGKRVLQLTLTDGVQEVIAMEYNPIKCLSLNLSPGVKIRLIGPIPVRRSRLMLKEGNIKVLGGEVEDLLVVNAAENVLARALNLPINPNPKQIVDNLFNVDVDETREGYKSNNTQKPQQVIRNDSIPKKSTEISEIDLLLEEEDAIRKEQFNNPFEDDLPLEDLDSVFEPEPKQPPKAHLNLNGQTDLAEMEVDDEFFDAENFGLTQNQQPSPIKVLTIAKLLAMQKSVFRGVFKVKARFDQVVVKLQIETEYSLVIRIEDETGKIDVGVASNIIAEYAGYSPAEIITFKARMSSGDRTVFELVRNALKRVKDRIIELNHIVSIQVTKGEKYPIITKIG